MADLRAVPALDGLNDAAQRDNVSAALNIGLSNWTVSAWIRTSAANTNNMTIAARYECGQGNCSSPDGNASSWWEFGVGPDGKLFFGARGDTGDNDFHSAGGTNDLRDGQFHHVAGVLDRGANLIRVFVDGVLAGTNSAAGVGEVRDPVSPFSIGKRFVVSFVSPQFFFNGNIYDVRVWTVVRSAANLVSDSAGPSRGDEVGLAGYWPLNEGFGSTAFDHTTNGNHLTLQGNPAWQALVSQTNTTDRIVQLQGFDPDNDALTASITTLPGAGMRLFQTLDGLTRGLQITNTPTLVSNANKRVILAPPLAASTNYFFRYRFNDGFANSIETTVALAAQAVPGADTDGDGLPDAYEVANNLNPEVNDAAQDADSDGLNNLREFHFGTLPRSPDSDNDGASDGNEVFGTFDLAAWWRAENDALDAARTNHGTLNGGAGFTAGVLGSSFSFDGADDSVSVPDDSAHRLQTFSLEAWIRTTGITPAALAGFIVAKSGNNGGDGFELAVGTPSQSGRLRFTMNGGQNGADLFSSASVTNGAFHHVVATYDGAVMRLYVDGQFDAQQAVALTVAYPAGIPLFIGRREHGTIPGFFSGQIDELTVHRLAVTPTQVTNLFLAGGLGSIGKGSHPLDPDTDDDGILDGIDPNPFTSNADFDGDGIPDADDPDIDGDSLSNTNELALGTDARKPDTDGDAWRDGAEVEAGSNPLLAASVTILFHVGQPEVGLILPTLIFSGAVTNGVTVAQPEVGLILPALAEFTELTNGVTVGQPEVGLILPGFQITEVTNGLTVAQPEVGLILPASPDFSSLTPGLTVAEPVVVLRLDVSARSESISPRIQGLVLRVAQLETASEVAAAALSTTTPASNRPKVVLEWTGPARGTYTIEASTNLQTWMAVPMEPLTSVNGTFRVRCDVVAPAATFYRLRHMP